MSILPLSVFLCLGTLFLSIDSFSDQNDGVRNFGSSSFSSPLLIKKDERKQIVATEFGEISAVQVGDGHHLQFITLEPHAFLLPLLLHSDMVLFVHTGSGILNWVKEEKERTLKLRRGDVFRLRSGTVFYLHSTLERDDIPEKLRVYAIFNVEECLHEPCLGAYSSIRDLLLGFNERTLRTAFAVPEELLRKLKDAAKPPLITNALLRNIPQGLEEETWQSRLVKLFVRAEDVTDHLAMKPVDNKKKKSRAYNVFEADPDFENVNGRSIVVDKKDMDALKGSSVGVHMVNLTKGAIMGPHWNPRASEISIVLQGQGMVRVVNHSSSPSSKSDKSERFLVAEGDVFVVPQFHPMAQISFDNSSFLFMGFSTSAKTNYPRFLVGQSSVLKVLDRGVLATSFNMRNETIERLLEAQKESVMLSCVSCAEVELIRLKKEIEEKRKCEEEEMERRKKEEEEEKRRREEEESERRRKEEEEARQREQERKREEEIAKKREEEKRRREEEETERRRKKEEAEAKKQEEERRRREEEEEEARKREEEREREEEKAKRQEEERKRREKEEEEARKREREAERAKEQEEERRKREKEEEAARRREEEREKEEEMAKKREEERREKEREEIEERRREEEARKREEEREHEEEMARKQEEERQKKEREEVEKKRREEEARKREEEREKEEEMARKREMERKRREEERKREEETAKRAEEERRRREKEEEKRRWPPQPQSPTTT